MRKIKNTNESVSTKRPKIWVWVVVGFIVGGCIGYATHYLIINWRNIFVVCPNENKPELCCPNGSNPDKNGCCEGEVYTDAGGGWMVCCPDGGDNCFPPMK